MSPRQPIKLSDLDKTASEEMSFENVDRRTDNGLTTDSFIYYKLTNQPLAQVS